MKSVMTAVLLLSSISTFAFDAYEGQGEIISGNQSLEVRKALLNDLQNGKWKCKGDTDIESVRSYFTSKGVNQTSAVVSIDTTGKNPVITSFLNGSSYTFSFKFKTTSDLTKVLSVEYVFSNLQTVVKNVGNLMNPRFENVIEDSNVAKTVCTSKTNLE